VFQFELNVALEEFREVQLLLNNSSRYCIAINVNTGGLELSGKTRSKAESKACIFIQGKFQRTLFNNVHHEGA
jgi:hypothetical protein